MRRVSRRHRQRPGCRVVTSDRPSSFPVVCPAVARTLALLRKAAVKARRDTWLPDVREGGHDPRPGRADAASHRVRRPPRLRCGHEPLRRVFGVGRVSDGILVYEGVDTIRREMEAWTAAFEEFEIDIDEIHDMGNGVVLSLTRQSGRPSGASGHVQMPFIGVTSGAPGRSYARSSS
jgi:hypothetical protein